MLNQDACAASGKNKEHGEAFEFNKGEKREQDGGRNCNYTAVIEYQGKEKRGDKQYKE